MSNVIKNEERRGPKPEKVEALRASARRVGPEGSGAQRGVAQTWKKLGPQGLGPEGWAPQRGGPKAGGQNFALFFSRRPPGFHTTARELQTCTSEIPGLQKHHQNSTRRPTEREKKRENGRGKEQREILGGPAEGGPAHGGRERG